MTEKLMKDMSDRQQQILASIGRQDGVFPLNFFHVVE
jgi:hypothetical protein